MDLIRDDVRDAIIASVRRISAEKDARKITVRDVLKDMGITNRVFYNRFRNIDEVLKILYDETTARVRMSLSIPWDENGDFFDHIRNAAERTLMFCYESRRNLSDYVFYADSAENTNFEWWTNEIRRLIEKGKEIGKLRTDLDVDAVAYAIWCFIRGYTADAMARALPPDAARARFRIGFECFLQGMMVQGVER